MAEKIEGLGGLRERFGRVGKDMELRTSRAMVVAAGGLLKREAKSIALANGHRLTGAMINNIAIKRERTPLGTAQYHLGVRHGRNLGSKAKKALEVKRSGRIGVKYVDDPFYWRFIELGRNIVQRDTAQEGRGVTSYFQRLRNGKLVEREKKWRASSITGRRRLATGSVPPSPFISAALENKRKEAVSAMEARLARELDKTGR